MPITIRPLLNNVTKQLTMNGEQRESLYGVQYTAMLGMEKVTVEETLKMKWTSEELEKLFGLMAQLRERSYPNIVQPMGYIIRDEHENRYGFVHERYTCDMYTFLFEREKTIFKGTKLTPATQYKMAIQCAAAVKTLHSLGFSHGDLFLESFFMNKQGDVFMGNYCIPQRLLGYIDDASMADDIIDLAMVIYMIFSQKEVESKEDCILPRTYREAVLNRTPPQERKRVKKELHENEGLQMLMDAIPYSLEKLLADALGPFEMCPTAQEFFNRLVDSSLLKECGGIWGADFWVYCLNQNGEVPDRTMSFDTLAEKISQATMIDIDEVRNTRNLLSNDGEVTTELMGKLTNTYGDFYNNTKTMLKLIEFATSPYLFFVSKDESQSMMNGYTDLTYLIRPSSTDPKFPFTLTKRAKGKTIHARIERNPDGFSITSASKKYTAPSIPELVDIMKENNIVKYEYEEGADSIY